MKPSKVYRDWTWFRPHYTRAVLETLRRNARRRRVSPRTMHHLHPLLRKSSGRS